MAGRQATGKSPVGDGEDSFSGNSRLLILPKGYDRLEGQGVQGGGELAEGHHQGVHNLQGRQADPNTCCTPTQSSPPSLEVIGKVEVHLRVGDIVLWMQTKGASQQCFLQQTAAQRKDTAHALQKCCPACSSS